MKRSKQKKQPATPQRQQEPGACRPAPASGSWIVPMAGAGSILVISAIVYVVLRPAPSGTLSQAEKPAAPPVTLVAGVESNQPAGAASEPAPGSSNWDAVISGLRNDGAAAELAKRASALLAAGDSKSAVRVLEEAVRVKPDDEDLHYNLGIAYSRSGDTSNAMHHYEEALRLLPDYPEVHNNLGHLLMRAGRLAEAEKAFTKAIELMPELSTAHNNLGIIRQSQKRMPEAIACFRKAIEYNTNYWQADYNLALASLSQGAKQEAVQALQTVLRLNPGYEPAQKVLNQILTKPSGQ